MAHVHGNMARNERPHQQRPKAPLAKVAASEMTERAQIKWYDPERHYGFVVRKGAPDAFLHESVVKLYRLDPASLEPDTAVYVKIGPSGDGRPQVIALRFAQGADAQESR